MEFQSFNIDDKQCHDNEGPIQQRMRQAVGYSNQNFHIGWRLSQESSKINNNPIDWFMICEYLQFDFDDTFRVVWFRTLWGELRHTSCRMELETNETMNCEKYTIKVKEKFPRFQVADHPNYIHFIMLFVLLDPSNGHNHHFGDCLWLISLTIILIRLRL